MCPSHCSREEWRRYRKTWELFFDHSPGGPGSFDVVELQITASETVAYCHGLVTVADATVRLTMGLRKEKNEWVIAHEHHSYHHRVRRRRRRRVAHCDDRREARSSRVTTSQAPKMAERPSELGLATEWTQFVPDGLQQTLERRLVEGQLRRRRRRSRPAPCRRAPSRARPAGPCTRASVAGRCRSDRPW